MTVVGFNTLASAFRECALWRQQVMAQVTGSCYPLTWETWTEFQAPSLGLAQPYLLQTFGVEPADGSSRSLPQISKISHPPPINSIFIHKKNIL